MCILLQGRQLAAQPNPFQGGRAAFAGLAAQAQRPQQAAWQQPAAAGWGVADMGAAGAPPRSNVPLTAAVVPATAAPLVPLQAPQQAPPQQAPGRKLLPDGTWCVVSAGKPIPKTASWHGQNIAAAAACRSSCTV